MNDEEDKRQRVGSGPVSLGEKIGMRSLQLR